MRVKKKKKRVSGGGNDRVEEKRRNVFPRTTLMPPEFSRLHIPSSGAIPIVVPLKITPLSEPHKHTHAHT